MNTLKSCGNILLLATVFLTASCHKDDDGTPAIPAASNYFVKGKVDGADYSNNVYAAPGVTLNAGTLMVQSSDNNGNSMQIQIPNYHGTGTYVSGSGNLAYGYINFSKRSGTTFTTYTSVRGSGEVVVTSATDTEIEGTFHAIAPENDESPSAQVQITEGTFKLKKP